MSPLSLLKWVLLIRKFSLLGIETQELGRRMENIKITPNHNGFL